MPSISCMRTTLDIDDDLLALAVAHGGRLVRFDRAIPTAAVHGVTTAHLVVL